ncbi:MAG: band 7 protein [Lentisphaerae bacterium RIFOXYB12_FULL_65_16]|nr:MAG: band 7 protein [Lentisphaerae bacterium RIFOXYA12_64_32]OGV91961.1 MAG: band 7 protein [Lentisphaerae bacterium RIFOXYB12_FULL_65_16]
MLPVTIALLLGGPALIIAVAVMRMPPAALVTGIIIGVLIEGTGILSAIGFFTLQPNEARVLILFGAYKGTVREAGFHWGNPFYANGGMEMAGGRVCLSRNKISLRLRNLNGEKLKVNDKRGNPIEIAAVVVWRVHDTAQAFFDVDNYTHYVQVQSEAAVRHLASRFAYDHGEENEANEVTLRGGVEQVSAALKQELEDRLAKAGVEVEEARITHLAYAPEIAQAMLRRQQAEAVIAARTKIVQGAVGMVSMALEELSKKGVVNLDDERRAAMVSNLMVVLCGESEVHPVVNTGTLYT